MRRILLAIMVIMLGTSTACISGLSLGQETSDNAHSLLIHSAQIIDKINGDISPEGESYLILKYEIENLQNRSDSYQQWTNQIMLETTSGGVTNSCESTLIESLDNYLRETLLLPNERKAGYMAFVVPEDASSFNLTFTFPYSGKKVSYDLRSTDKRIGVNADYVLMSLGQKERAQKIPLIGGLFAAFTSAPIRYLGVILVPEEEVSQLLEQTRVLPDDAKRKVIEDYLLAHGHCRLE